MEQNSINGKVVSVPTKTILYLSVTVFLFVAVLILTNLADLVLVTFFIALGLFLLLFYLKSRIVADSISVRSYGITGKFKEIKWGEINKIEFPKSYGTENGIVKVSDGSKTIALTGLYNRHHDILELLAQKLNPELHKDAIGKINQLVEKHR